MRLIAVLQNLPPRDTDTVVRPPRPKPVPLDELLSNSQHVLKQFGDRHVCTRCLNGFTLKDPQIRQWLLAPCVSEMVHSISRPNPLPAAVSFHIGNQSVHSSHTLRQHKGLIYCPRSGYIASIKMHKLADECGHPGKYGLRILNNIRNDQLPYGMDLWPSQRLGLPRLKMQ